MLERLIIAVVLVLLGLLAYRLFNKTHVRRVSQRVSYDPLLSDFSFGNPGLVLFTADYCAPCKMQQRPAIQRLAQELGNTLQVIEVDIEQHPEVAQRWGVMSLPTTFILDGNGEPRDVNHGVTSTDKLKKQLQAVGR